MAKRAGDWPDVMTVEQVAAYLQLNKLTVYKFVRDGRIPASRLGKSYRIQKADVDGFLESQKLRAGTRTRAVRRPEVSAPKRLEEIVVAPQRPETIDVRERDISLKDPLDWVIRGLH